MPESQSNPYAVLSEVDGSGCEPAVGSNEEVCPENDPHHSRNFGLGVFYMVLMLSLIHI